MRTAALLDDSGLVIKVPMIPKIHLYRTAIIWYKLLHKSSSLSCGTCPRFSGQEIPHVLGNKIKDNGDSTVRPTLDAF